MWRAGRAASALLLRLQAGRAGARRLRATSPAEALRVPTWATSQGLRSVSGSRSSELRDAEEGAGAEEEQRQAVAEAAAATATQEQYPASTFSLDYIVSLLRQENAKDICVIQLPPEMKYSSYFIVVSGSSTRHLHAMAHYVVKMYKHLKTDSETHVLLEGKDCDDWLCIDFGNVVVHFMLPETREIYGLERLWTLRSYDDQLAEIVVESLPDDFIFGLTSEQ